MFSVKKLRQIVDILEKRDVSQVFIEGKGSSKISNMGMSEFMQISFLCEDGTHIEVDNEALAEMGSKILIPQIKVWTCERITEKNGK